MPCWPVKGIYIVEQKIFGSQVKEFDCFLNARSQNGLTPDLAVFGRKCHSSSDHCEDQLEEETGLGRICPEPDGAQRRRTYHRHGDPQPRVRQLCPEASADFRWPVGGAAQLS
jgi:hypothetical protein